MATVYINFGALRDASAKASSASGRLGAYADALDSTVRRPLGSLTGGSSPSTSLAASIASEKARELRAKAEGYRSLAGAVRSFSDSAKTIDAQVGRSIKCVANGRAADLPWWKKVGYELYSVFNGALGATEVGKLFKQLVTWREALKAKGDQIRKKVLDWFKHGDGRYVLQFAESFLAAVGAGLAIFACSGPLAIAAAALLAVVFVKKAFDTGACLASSITAIQENGTEPGLAYYHGSANSMSAVVKQNSTSKKTQGIFKTIDMVSAACELVAGAFLLFSPPELLKNASSKKDVVVANLKAKLGFSPVEMADGSIGFEFNPFGIKSGALSAKDKVDIMKHFVGGVKGSLNLDKTFNKLITGGMGGSRFEGAKDLVSWLSSIFGGIGALGDSKTVMGFF